MYDRPVRLNRTTHLALRFNPPLHYMFCRAMTATPLMGIEFPAACRHYPIVVVQGADGALSAQAVLSLREDENAFVDRQGQWTASYIPAAIRRYPFAIADIPGNPADFDVAIDEASECFSPNHGQALFTPEGAFEPALQAQIDFLRMMQAEHQRTQAFLEAVRAAGLLTPRNVDVVRADRQRFGVRNALVVDEARLLALPASTSHAFLTSGYLGWIYAHLLSLQCFVALANRAGQPLDDVVPWWAK